MNEFVSGAFRRPGFRALLGILAWAAGLAAASEPAPPSRGVFWKVESETTTVYLFGSVHAGSPDLYPLDDRIVRAFERASVLAVEADTRPDRLPDLTPLMRSGLLPEGKSLRDELPGEIRNLLEERIRRMDPAVGAALDRMQPWMAAFAIAIQDIQAAGLDPKWGVDLHFLNRAAESGKEVIELEGVRKQLAMLIELGQANQRLFLKHSLLDTTRTSAQIREMVALWKAGDENALARKVFAVFEKHDELAPIRKRLFADRNIEMARRIRAFLEERRTVFVVVGAGHLLDRESILAQLEKAGFAPVRMTAR